MIKGKEGKTMFQTEAFRLLKAEEIECRVGVINEKGLSLLLFKDARVDQKILDETFTPFGWKRSHQVIDGNLYCTVEIWDGEKNQWISKQDVGTGSYSEKEKGQASDSFKRACFNWGIGRELYSAPFIWIPAALVKIRFEDNRYKTSDRFCVKAIAYNDSREIRSLEITGSSGKTVFSMPMKQPAGALEGKKGRTPDETKQELRGKAERELLKELERTGVPLETVLKRYGIGNIGEMMPEIYRNAMSGLKKSKPRNAA